MTDYSFMRSGRGQSVERTLSDEDQDNIRSILALFTSNAMINGAEYSKICGRSGVTKEDVKYGLIFEVFEFTQRPSTMSDLKELREEMENDDDDDDEDDDGWEDMDDFVVPDEDVEEFKRVNIDDVPEENKEFVRKIHAYYDNWCNWRPSNRIEEILKNAIDTIQ